jgi:hypothetical protein
MRARRGKNIIKRHFCENGCDIRENKTLWNVQIMAIAKGIQN